MRRVILACLVFALASSAFGASTTKVGGTGTTQVGGSGLTKVNEAPFNILTSITWDVLFFGDNAPGHGSDGTASDWTDVTGTKTLTSATQAIYRASVADFNSHAAWQGNGTPTYLAWDRGSNLSQPYSVVIVGKHPSGLGSTAFSILVGDFNALNFYNWLANDTTIYDAAQASSGRLDGRDYTASASFWHTVFNGASSKSGRNSLAQVTSLTTNINGSDTDVLHGLTLFRYPTSAALYTLGYVALVGVYSGDITANAQWPNLVTWIGTYYGINQSTRKMVLVDGASRANGPAYMGAGTSNQYGKIWPYLLQTGYTESVETTVTGVPNQTHGAQNTRAATAVDATFAATNTTGTKVIIDHNDGALNSIAGGATAIATYAEVVTYVNARRTTVSGVKIMLCTQPTYVGISAPHQTALTAFNLLVTSNGASLGETGADADGVCDLAASVLLDPNVTPANFIADGLHYSVAGHVVVAGLVETTLAASPFSVTRSMEVPTGLRPAQYQLTENARRRQPIAIYRGQ